MVIEALLGGGELLEGGLMAAETTTLLGSGLIMSGGAGAVAGLMAKDMTHAAAYSALAGLALPVISSGKKTPDRIILSIMASTAVGLIVHHLKTNYVAREEAKNSAASVYADSGIPKRA